MRFRINLTIPAARRFLPFDYQYALSSAVYRIIARGDEAYSRFLHDEGFPSGRLKRFKMFTFGPLELPRYTQHKGQGLFELYAPELSFVVSFMADKAAEAFVKGMFAHQEFHIDQLPVEVTSVEALPPPFFKTVMEYRCISPMVVGLREDRKRHETYLAPDDPRFEERLVQNLLAKCAALDTLCADSDQDQPVKFTLRGGYRSKLHSIKPHSKEETRVRGFVFEFALTAPEHVHELGYYAGFGMNNAMGFGAVRCWADGSPKAE